MQSDLSSPVPSGQSGEGKPWQESLSEVVHRLASLELEVRARGEREAFRSLTQAIARLGRHHDGTVESPMHGEFQRRARDVITESTLCRHSLEKPRGYAGDFQAMDLIWKGQTRPASYRYLGTTKRGGLLNAFTLDSANCRANLSRVLKLRDLLLEHDGGRVASVGCGSMIELGEALAARPGLKLELELFDQEADALESAEARAAGATVKLRSHCGNVLRNVFKQDSESKPFDLLYASGLFDYFSVAQSRRMVTRMWTRVAPGGRLLVVNEHPGNPTQTWMALGAEWVLQSKDETEMRSLTDDLHDVASVGVQLDSEGVYQYLEVRREP